MVPVAGQDAFLDRAPVEREAHVRAAVIDRVDGFAVLEQGQGVSADRTGQASAGLEVGQTGGKDEAIRGIDHW